NPGTTLNLDNAAGNLGNRLGGHSITLNGATFNIFGNNNNNASESVPTFNLGGGQSVFTMTAVGSSGQGTFSQTTTGATGFTRANNSTILFRGSSLGSAAGSGIAVMSF